VEQLPITDERRTVFLATLSRTGSFAEAARAASPHARSGAVTSFRDLARRDPGFAAEVEEAMHEARGVVEAEIHRRAVEGVERVVYGKDGKPIGTVREYSDRLLELKARAVLPEYRGQGTSINVGVGVSAHAASFGADLEGLRSLPPEDQDLLRGILERAAIRKRAGGDNGGPEVSGSAASLVSS
jgi:hypothetical protein